MELKHKTAQILSTDLIIVVAFVLLSTLFVVFNQINLQQERNFEEIRQDSKTISDSIYNTLWTSNIIGGNNDVDLIQLRQINEDQIRQQLNIDRDFAIAFEKDGKLIYIDSEEGISCIGSNKIVINERSCGFFD
ncbi:MAG: hypothetical protein ACMXYB_05510 [Candidatus Woesearchaeota archaeon]